MSQSQVWIMGLEKDPFERIASGRKVVEFRLDKPKWKNLAVGDKLTFAQEPCRTKTIIVEVAELMRYATFRDLLKYCERNGLLEEGQTVEEQVRRLQQRYPESEREKYSGVLGIRVKAIRE